MSGSFSAPQTVTTHYLPGEHCETATHGDLVLVRHKGRIPALIRFGQRLRFHGANRQYTWCNHAMTVISDGPHAEVEEQTGRGGIQTSLADYVAELYVVVHVTDAVPEQRAAAARFGIWCVGTKYGWASIVAAVLYLTTGIRLTLGWGTSGICSADAGRGQERLGLIPDKLPESVLPADLARYFDVGSPV